MKKSKVFFDPDSSQKSIFYIQILGFICAIILATIFYKSGSNPVAAQIDGYEVDAIYFPVVFHNYPHRTIFGVEMDQIANSQGLEKMVSAGADWVRRNGVLWSELEPVQGGGYDWSVLEGLEEELLLARSNQMEPILIVRGVPVWAQVGPFYHACGPIAPSTLSAFGNFIYALVQRYSSAPYQIKYLEIWNEPDVDPSLLSNGDLPFGCLGDKSDTLYYGGKKFATVLQTVSLNAKAANPNIKIIVGGLLLDCNPNDPPYFQPEKKCIPSRYLEGILAVGGKSYFDGISFHAYDFFSLDETFFSNGIYGNPGWNNGGFSHVLVGDLKPVVVAKSRYIKNTLSAYGASGKFLMNTETGLLCGGALDPPGGSGCESTPDSSFEKLKASYVPQTYAAAIAEGLVANIWYTPRGWRNSGLLNSDLTPRPAYHAFVLAHDMLKNAAFIREVNEFASDQIFGYEFMEGMRKFWIVWTLDGKSHDMNLQVSPIAVWDEVGLPVYANGNAGILTIEGLKTIYIDWEP
jgi:hypothetical protein